MTAPATIAATTTISWHSSAALPLPKRLRKKVEHYNPSAFLMTRKKRTSSISARRSESSRGPGRPRRVPGNGNSGQKGRATRKVVAYPTSINSTSTPSQQHHRSRQERREDQKLNDAAHASRLHAHGLCTEEFELFQYHIGRSDLESYLKVRNTMLWLWRENPSVPLTLARAFEETKNFGLHHGLIAHIYEFLLRSGYINFGGCAFQNERTQNLECKENEKPEFTHHETIRPPTSSGTRKTIVVIGSGIAGVGAARQLENLFQYYAWRFVPDLPPRVIVLEARSRVGGRMHSLELQTKPHLLSISGDNMFVDEHIKQDWQNPKSQVEKHCVDLGAQIITGFENGNPMEIIVRRQLSDLQLHFLSEGTCDLYGHDGQLVPKAMDIHCEAVFNEILEQACQLRDEDEIPKALQAYLKERAKIDSRGPGRVLSTDLPTLGHSMDYFIQTHPEFKTWTFQELGLIHWHYANLEFANATPLDQLSLRHWDQDDDYEFAGDHCMVKEGYGQVPVRLSRGLDVRFEQIVSMIERSVTTSESNHRSTSSNEPIHIHCRNGVSYECSAAVVTVPLGVLKSHQIQFLPPLPDWKEQAISNLGFGLLNKLVLVFDKVFWSKDVELFGYVGSGQECSSKSNYNLKAYRSSRGKFYMYWNCNVVSGLPVLVTLMAGQSAYDCEKISKEELVQEALESLALIHPNIKIPTPVETIVTRWSQDEFAQGSYSFVGQKGTGDDYDRLAKSVGGQLYFAGEATSRQYPATAHGAYLSGLRAAKEILDTLIGPQVVRTRHDDGLFTHTATKEEEEDIYGTKSENEMLESYEASSNGSNRSHLLSMEDAYTTDTPPPDSKVEPSLFMSLGHGFIVPRRRGRVSRSIVAKFVAERSEDDSDNEEESDDSENDNGTDEQMDEEEKEASNSRKTSLKPYRTTAQSSRAKAPEITKRSRGRPPKKSLSGRPTAQPNTISSSKTKVGMAATATATVSGAPMIKHTANTMNTGRREGLFKRKISVGNDSGGRVKVLVRSEQRDKHIPVRQTRARYEAHYLGHV
ncbi:hypothetical protein FBU30_007572 [Linnemannia zychae]|nr:hypothetical protein FBU30_007572 [Linnemannia zychae]